jgi:hypothetical protein
VILRAQGIAHGGILRQDTYSAKAPGEIEPQVKKIFRINGLVRSVKPTHPEVNDSLAYLTTVIPWDLNLGADLPQRRVG